MENESFYQFYMRYKFCTGSEAQQSDICEAFAFLPEHPQHDSLFVVPRLREAVPVFPWNFLPSTRSFPVTIHDPTIIPTAPMEGYSYRFQILFRPFRTRSDLIATDGTYTAMLRMAYVNQEIDPAMMKVAENIQNIHNSLHSDMVQNPLKERTECTEDNGQDDIPSEHDEEDDNCLTDIMAMLSEATESDGEAPLTAESPTMDPQFTSFGPRNEGEVPLDIPFDLDDVIIGLHSVHEDAPMVYGDVFSHTERFRTPVTALNSLVLQCRCVDEGGNCDPSGPQVQATGTWQSIRQWGEIAGLDPEQKVAFEILSATYVLTFYNDATYATENDARKGFEANIIGLNVLGRHRSLDGRPLRMFITGPAGAGKCKLC